MSTRSIAIAVLLIGIMPGPLAAQQRGAAPPPGQSEPPVPSLDQPNIQFSIDITDEGTGFVTVKKNVVLIAQGGGAGSLRSSGTALMLERMKQQPQVFTGINNTVSVELNVDVKMPPYIAREPGKIRARIGIEYQPFSAGWKELPGRVRAQVDALLLDGKKMTLWQTTDPVTGLRTMIEVTATVMK
jgi:hypothetical protein